MLKNKEVEWLNGEYLRLAQIQAHGATARMYLPTTIPLGLLNLNI